MKNLLLPVVAVALALAGCDKNDSGHSREYCGFVDFKYYNGAKFNLGELQNSYILLGIDSSYSDAQIRHFISTLSQVDQSYAYTIHQSGAYKFKEIPLRFAAPKTCEEITQLISFWEKNKIVSYAHYTMKSKGCLNLIGQKIGNLCIVSYGSNFYVKLFNEKDLTVLKQKIAETHTELVAQWPYQPTLFELRATKESKGDALKMANYFQESGLFEYSDPGVSGYPVE